MSVLHSQIITRKNENGPTSEKINCYTAKYKLKESNRVFRHQIVSETQNIVKQAYNMANKTRITNVICNQ